MPLGGVMLDHCSFVKQKVQ